MHYVDNAHRVVRLTLFVIKIFLTDSRLLSSQFLVRHWKWEVWFFELELIITMSITE